MHSAFIHRKQRLLFLPLMFPVSFLTENIQGFYEIYSTLLPSRTTVKALNAMCKSCSSVFGCDLNPHSQCSILHEYAVKVAISVTSRAERLPDIVIFQILQRYT
jgi:hypothetical protein